MYQKISEKLERTINGKNALDYVDRIWQSDRYFDFSAMHRTACYLTSEMRKIGLEEVEIINMPADGKTWLGTICSNRAWRVRKALVDIIHPNGKRERIVDYAKNPCQVNMYSGSTPKGGVKGKLIFVDDATKEENFIRKEISGKYILTFTKGWQAKPLALKYQAAGILSAYMWNPELKDSTFWGNAWSDDGKFWGYRKVDTSLIGINISPRLGRYLRDLIRKNNGSIDIWLCIETEEFNGKCPIITGVLPNKGDSKEEVVLVGHPFEQGAIDNASGCGLRLELARSLIHLFRQGKLPLPKRRIRLLFAFEVGGTEFYAWHYQDRGKRVVTAIELDSIGENHIKCRAPLGIRLTPLYSPSFLDGFAITLLQEFGFTKQKDFSGWQKLPSLKILQDIGTSDADRIAFLNRAPAIRFANANYFWHTNEDTIDKISPENLRLIGVVVGTLAYFVAIADFKEAAFLADTTANYGIQRLTESFQRELTHLSSKKKVSRRECEFTLNQIYFLLASTKESVASSERLISPSKKKKFYQTTIKPLHHRLEQEVNNEIKRLKQYTSLSLKPTLRAKGFLSKQIRRIKPHALFPTPPLSIPEEGNLSINDCGRRLVGWMDGRRTFPEVCFCTLQDISLARNKRLSTIKELRKLLDSPYSIPEYLQLLRQHKIIDW